MKQDNAITTLLILLGVVLVVALLARQREVITFQITPEGI